TEHDFITVMQALRNQEINIEEFITHRCQFDELTSCFENWILPESKVIKGIVSF
ncbi:MAG: alcohol dehydrogenase, partial [Verrucomicrobiaceae bacterium]|nr:alcohol dehydrogenase [Verrucomicrobiaceae bacterium]